MASKHREDCERCGNSREIEYDAPGLNGVDVAIVRKCPFCSQCRSCDGVGWQTYGERETRCKDCDGTGLAPDIDESFAYPSHLNSAFSRSEAA